MGLAFFQREREQRNQKAVQKQEVKEAPVQEVEKPKIKTSKSKKA